MRCAAIRRRCSAVAVPCRYSACGAANRVLLRFVTQLLNAPQSATISHNSFISYIAIVVLFSA
jgi:hypothetical protein